MNFAVEFKNLPPSTRLRDLASHLIARLERHAPRFPPDAVSLRLMIEENATRALYHVSLTGEVPGRTLRAQEERHDADEAIRAAFAEIERQLQRHKEILKREYLYKGPARREEVRREKVAVPDERAQLDERHRQLLADFVQREIASYEATGDLQPGEVTPDDVVGPVLERAAAEIVRRPEDVHLGDWLTELMVGFLADEVTRRARKQGRRCP